MANGMFSGILLTPEQVQESRRQAMFEQARTAASLTPQQQALMLARESGQNLGNVISGLFGVEDPELKKARDFQNAAMSIKDRLTPEQLSNPSIVYGEMARAAIALGYPNEALQFVQASQRQRPAAQKPLQIDLGDRVELRDPITGRVIETIRKGITPAQREKMAEQEAQERPGFIGKTGAYRNKFGEVIPATEMSKQRQGFVQAQDLLAKLNKIDYDTVKKAQSPFDYTEPGITKSIGSQVASSTVNAQTTIAASQLLEQIEKLPPGSASDADMRAAVRDFPGYGDAKNLADWVNRTKETLAESLARQNELYGFPVQVKATPRIGPKKKEQPAESTGEWRIIP